MQQIVQHLFRVNSLEEVPRERLEELVSTYPSFGVGHYLLSRKLHTEDAGHFSEETQKTNLYFSNPFWLHWLLQNGTEEQKPAYTRPAATVANVVAEERMVEEEQSWGMPAIAEEQEVTDEPEFGGQPGVDEGSIVTEPVPEEGTAAAGEPVARDETAVETAVAGQYPTVREAGTGEEQGPAGESFFQEKLGIEAEASATPSIENSGVTAAVPTAAEALLQSLEEARGLRQALVQMNETREEAPVHQDPITPVEMAPVEARFEEIPVESRVEDVPVEARFEETSEEARSEDAQGGVVGIAESRAEEASLPEAALVTEDKGAEPPVSVSGTGHENSVGEHAVGHEIAGTPEPSVTAVAHAVPEAEPIVEFEPYYTIDYFASVGIKLIQEDNPSDKLGKQLKSFTEWLKIMRKLPQKNQEIVPDGAVEHQIQAIAAHSIKGKEILTETMAEVLVKQGMREKAMDVYHKLSLLNPDKSAYFATKIEQLKID